MLYFGFLEPVSHSGTSGKLSTSQSYSYTKFEGISHVNSHKAVRQIRDILTSYYETMLINQIFLMVDGKHSLELQLIFIEQYMEFNRHTGSKSYSIGNIVCICVYNIMAVRFI